MFSSRWCNVKWHFHTLHVGIESNKRGSPAFFPITLHNIFECFPGWSLNASDATHDPTWPNVWYGSQVDTIWQWNTIQFLDLHTCPSDAMDLSRARLAQLSGSPDNGSKNMRNIIWEMMRNATFEQQSLPRMNNPYQSITKPSCAWKVTGAEWEPFANDLTNLYHRIWCDIICDDLTYTVPCHDATWTVYRFSSFWCTIQRTDQA